MTDRYARHRLAEHVTDAGHSVEQAHRRLSDVDGLTADQSEDINDYLLGIARDLRAIHALITGAPGLPDA